MDQTSTFKAVHTGRLTDLAAGPDKNQQKTEMEKPSLRYRNDESGSKNRFAINIEERNQSTKRDTMRVWLCKECSPDRRRPNRPSPHASPTQEIGTHAKLITERTKHRSTAKKDGWRVKTLREPAYLRKEHGIAAADHRHKRTPGNRAPKKEKREKTKRAAREAQRRCWSCERTSRF